MIKKVISGIGFSIYGVKFGSMGFKEVNYVFRVLVLVVCRDFEFFCDVIKIICRFVLFLVFSRRGLWFYFFIDFYFIR